PGDPVAGAKILIDDTVVNGINDRLADQTDNSVAVDGGERAEAALFYASVDERDDGIYTTTSRAFAVVGVADTIDTAEEVVEETLADAGTEGLRVRHDIGTRDLVDARIEHMHALRGE